MSYKKKSDQYVDNAVTTIMMACGYALGVGLGSWSGLIGFGFILAFEFGMSVYWASKKAQ